MTGYAGAPVSAYAPQANSSTPVILEAVLAFFGFFGIGWLVGKQTTVGVILLIAGFVWDSIAVFGSIITLGFGALCLFPIHLGLVALSAILLNSQLKKLR